jgi:DNA-binding PadR family transcriptional regulator
MASKRLGRTQDPTILVLTSLTGGPKHGYAVIKDIESMSGVSFGPGTLYGVLARLEEEGDGRATARSRTSAALSHHGTRGSGAP